MVQYLAPNLRLQFMSTYSQLPTHCSSVAARILMKFNYRQFSLHRGSYNKSYPPGFQVNHKLREFLYVDLSHFSHPIVS